MGKLLRDYGSILSTLDLNKIDIKNDKYSGIFLPVAFDEYFVSNKKIMLIGRETAGWNTNNHKNTLKRITENNPEFVVTEATERYKKHLLLSKGEVITKSRSRCKQFYFKIAKELKVAPSSLIYGNLLAWDYNKKSPLNRPEKEFEYIRDISLELLSVQIKEFKPDYIVFSTGARKILDDSIKKLFDTYFDGYETKEFIRKKFWQFEADGATCFRIAHPRATHGHQEFRQLVINKLKQ